jgi:aryl-alcohol dehydrogenase-like predicted oxidoreductase
MSLLLQAVLIVLLQSTHNLMVRGDVESGMIEACSAVNGDMAMVACSPLAGGALSGKYLEARAVDPSLRMHRFVGYMSRFVSRQASEAVRAYKAVADEVSMPLAPLALAWVYSRPYVTSTVIGATTLSQLEDNVMALNVPVSEEVAGLVEAVHRRLTEPARGVFDVVDPYVEYTDPATLPWGGKDQDVDPELDILINQRLMKNF